MVNQTVPVEKLLKPNEVSVCKKIAASDDLDGQRAAALLAIHSGESQAIAADASGLSLGQVRYIVKRFRELGLEALPSTQKNTVVKAKTAPATVVEVEADEQKQLEVTVSKDKKPKKKAKLDKKKKPKKSGKDKKSNKKDKSDKDKKAKKKNKKKK
jgi:outer membrane biosynthesis protein TonB